MAYIERIDGMGNGSMLDGMLEAIGSGYIESEIAQASYRYQQRVESGDYTIVGVNDEYSGDATNAGSLELFEFDYAEEERQIERLSTVRQSRSEADAAASLRDIAKTARADGNLMPPNPHRRRRRRHRGRNHGRPPRPMGRVRGPGGVLAA